MRYGLLNDVRKLDKEGHPLMVQRFVALALPEGAPVPGLDEITAPHLQVSDDSRNGAMAAHNLNLDRPVLGLCPGAEFGPAKRWPEHHYAAVAQHWIERGGQFPIMSLGGLLLAVVVAGLVSSCAATLVAVRSPLLAALRSE